MKNRGSFGQFSDRNRLFRLGSEDFSVEFQPHLKEMSKPGAGGKSKDWFKDGKKGQKLQETNGLNGKIDGFRCRFSLKPYANPWVKSRWHHLLWNDGAWNIGELYSIRGEKLHALNL